MLLLFTLRLMQWYHWSLVHVAQKLEIHCVAFRSVAECLSRVCYQAFPCKPCFYTEHYQFIMRELKVHLCYERGTIASVLQHSVSVFQGRSSRKAIINPQPDPLDYQ